MTNSATVTVGLVNYNNQEMIEECINSVLCQTSGSHRVIFVDNNSTDGSFELVKEKFGDKLEIICLKENRGPNPARNMILEMAETQFVLFLDADVVLESDVIHKLVNVLNNYPDVALASPKIMDYENKEQLQFMGTFIHYIGAAIHFKKDIEDNVFVTSLGGACLLVRRDIANLIEGWDEELFFGWTDGDFVYRFLLAGHNAVSVGSAKIYHLFKERAFSKSFYQIRNRWYFMLKTYSFRTLIIIAPMLVLYELFLLSFLTLKRQTSAYFGANISVIRSLNTILKKRRSVQSLRRVRDGEILKVGDITFRTDIQDNSLLRIGIFFFNKVFDAYWFLARRVC